MFPLTRVPVWYRFFEPQDHVWISRQIQRRTRVYPAESSEGCGVYGRDSEQIQASEGLPAADRGKRAPLLVSYSEL